MLMNKTQAGVWRPNPFLAWPTKRSLALKVGTSLVTVLNMGSSATPPLVPYDTAMRFGGGE